MYDETVTIKRLYGDKLVGNSEVLAKDLHGLLGAETFAIRVKNLYPEAYQETVDIAREEKNTNSRPELLSAAPVWSF